MSQSISSLLPGSDPSTDARSLILPRVGGGAFCATAWIDAELRQEADRNACDEQRMDVLLGLRSWCRRVASLLEGDERMEPKTMRRLWRDFFALKRVEDQHYLLFYRLRAWLSSTVEFELYEIGSGVVLGRRDLCWQGGQYLNWWSALWKWKCTKLQESGEYAVPSRVVLTMRRKTK